MLGGHGVGDGDQQRCQVAQQGRQPTTLNPSPRLPLRQSSPLESYALSATVDILRKLCQPQDQEAKIQSQNLLTEPMRKTLCF